jgi:hypothetical protein
MLWFILVALILFNVAVFSAYFHAHTTTGCRSVRLNRGALLLISVFSFASFYPLLIVYFRLYPVSSPNHFTLTLSTIMLALVGLLISLFPKRLVNLHTQGWRRKQILLLAGLLLCCSLGSGWLLRTDMASGSLLSWWSPLFLVLFVIEAFCFWDLLLQIPVQLRLRRLAEQSLQKSAPSDVPSTGE